MVRFDAPTASAYSRENRFNEMLRQRSVTAVFQPLRDLTTRQTIGYELLGRCEFAGLPRNPLQLLNIATHLDKEIELSELFREVGTAQADQLGNRHTLFINTAPAEFELPRLAQSLQALRRQTPETPLVLELAETTVTSLASLRELRALLSDLCIELAYDDFGVGQARLIELIEVPPEWLKFDISFVQSLRSPSPRARTVLQTMVSLANSLGIKTVAEGIENESDLTACRNLGFDAAQGFYLGRPLPFFTLS